MMNLNNSARTAIRRNARWLLCLTTLIMIMIIIASTENYLVKENKLEQIVLAELYSHKTDNIDSIDLRKILGDKWRKVCIQRPYILKFLYEKLVEENIPNFKGLNDDRNALWIFYQDGHSSRIEIEVKVMDAFTSKGTSCTSPDQPFLYFEKDNGIKKYSIDNMRR